MSGSHAVDSQLLPSVRGSGALVGAALPLAIALVASATATFDPIAMDFGDPAAFVGFVSLYGIPVGALLGWLFAPDVARAESQRDVAGRALLMAIGAVVLGAFEVGVVLGVASAATTSADPITSFLLAATFLPLLGIVVLGLPALAVVVPVTMVWAVLVRRAISAHAASAT